MTWRRPLQLALALVGCAGAARGQDAIVPNQMHRALTFELHSVRDEVEIYASDPQFLFQIDVRPLGSVRPRIEFSNTGQMATLRVRDLTLFEPTEPLPEDVVDEEEAALLEEEKRRERRQPDAQEWEMQLMPAAPTDFVLQCDGGKASIDFTDIQVQQVHLIADTAQVRIGFKRLNPVPLRRFKLTSTAGSLKLHGFLNARAKQTSLQLRGAECDIDLTGTPFDGESEIFLDGAPESIRITVPRDVGLWLDGPAGTILRFESKDLERRAASLASPDYERRRCRMHLYFSHAMPNLEVRWQD